MAQAVFSPEGVVGLVPKRGCLFTLAYYAFPRWHEFGERRWNDTLTGENRRTRRKTCSSVTLFTTNPTWIDLGAKPGLRGERPATNDLRHGPACRLLTAGNRVCYQTSPYAVCDEEMAIIEDFFPNLRYSRQYHSTVALYHLGDKRRAQYHRNSLSPSQHQKKGRLFYALISILI
jgi:hypothetical protein